MNIFKNEIENIFRNSRSGDEIFDFFIKAINNRIKDADLYKILLWNKALSADEISMYAGKICQEFPDLSYTVYIWVGQIFELISEYGEFYEKAFNYYLKAASLDPVSHEPYSAILKLYNPDLDVPKLNDIITVIKQGILTVNKKSVLCFGLSGIYGKSGDVSGKRYYQKMGEQFRREGN